MTKAWSHLPNAVLIDRVIAAVGANTETWAAVGAAARDAAWDAVWRTAWDAAWKTAEDAAEDAVCHAARDAVCHAAWDAARDAVCHAARDAARGAARDQAWLAARFAVLALVAWDDCDHLLDLEPDQVRVLALLGHHPAVLLLPAVIALNKSITYSA